MQKKRMTQSVSNYIQTLIILLIIFISISTVSSGQTDPYSVELARDFSRDLFETNGVAYLQPLVVAVNSTSNARFFNQSHVPQKVDKPYFRIGIHGMTGIVREDMKTYSPVLPSKPYNLTELLSYMNIDPINQKVIIKDTSDLIHYLFLTICDEGLKRKSLNVPPKAPTVLGSGKTTFKLPRDTVKMLIDNHPLWKEPLWQLLPESTRDSVKQSLLSGIFPYLANLSEDYYLAEGGNINTIIAAIPQIEIGAIFGTELLIRFIPPVNMGKNIGDFAFWGIGLKHSITQYFNDKSFDAALQVVYQGTSLKNKIGVTNADMKANATILNLNLQASKSFEDVFDIFTGFSYEHISISSDYKYYLPVEIQWHVGLLEPLKFEPTPGFPGDQNPQTASLQLSDDNFKWIIGISKSIGPIAIFLDFSISKFDIFSGGIEYRF